MAQENSGLLIAALVAIVAVVGLVILFKGGASQYGVQGAAICAPGEKVGIVGGGMSTRMCMPMEDAELRHVSFFRPYGKKGAWKKFEHPKTIRQQF